MVCNQDIELIATKSSDIGFIQFGLFQNRLESQDDRSKALILRRLLCGKGTGVCSVMSSNGNVRLKPKIRTEFDYWYTAAIVPSGRQGLARTQG